MKKEFFLLMLPCAIFSSAAETIQNEYESPKSILKIDDFLPDKKNWSFNSGINILNSGREGGHPGFYINQIGPAQYIVDRTSFAYKNETNGVSGYLSAIYGLTNQLSLSTTINGQWVNTKYSTESGNSSTKNEYKNNGIGIGANYQFYRLSDFTVLFGGINLNNEKIGNYTLGSAMNWIYDPLVLGFSLGYLNNISKERFSNKYTAYTTSGKVTFAINPEVNLNWVFSKDFIRSNNDYISKREWSSNNSLLLGSTINVKEDLVAVIGVKGGVGNNKNSVISLGLSYKP